jgi:hypothetical protein
VNLTWFRRTWTGAVDGVVVEAYWDGNGLVIDVRTPSGVTTLTQTTPWPGSDAEAISIIEGRVRKHLTHKKDAAIAISEERLDIFKKLLEKLSQEGT